jgi:hypothetical protein
VSRPTPLIALLLATSITSGCGGSEPVAARDGVVEVRLTDFRVKPQVIRVKKDSLTIRVRNDGRLPHAFRIRGTGGTRLKLSTLMPGEAAARVGITLPRGDWRLFCPLANHEELGMYGSLVIR